MMTLFEPCLVYLFPYNTYQALQGPLTLYTFNLLTLVITVALLAQKVPQKVYTKVTPKR